MDRFSSFQVCRGGAFHGKGSGDYVGECKAFWESIYIYMYIYTHISLFTFLYVFILIFLFFCIYIFLYFYLYLYINMGSSHIGTPKYSVP